MPRSLTFTICIKVQYTASPHYSLQRNDLIEGHPKEFIVIEPTRWRVVGFMGTEIMVTKGKPFFSEKRKGRGLINQ